MKKVFYLFVIQQFSFFNFSFRKCIWNNLNAAAGIYWISIQKKSLQGYLEFWNWVLNAENQVAAFFLSLIYRELIFVSGTAQFCARRILRVHELKRSSCRVKKHYLNYCSESSLGFLGVVCVFTFRVVNCMHSIKSTENS